MLRLRLRLRVSEMETCKPGGLSFSMLQKGESSSKYVPVNESSARKTRKRGGREQKVSVASKLENEFEDSSFLRQKKGRTYRDRQDRSCPRYPSYEA